MRRYPRRALVLALAALGAALAGCGDDSFDLPSVGGDADAADSGDLTAVAKAFHDCLAAVDIQTTYDSTLTGAPDLVVFPSDVRAIFSTGTGPQMSEGVPEAEADAFYEEWTQGFTYEEGQDEATLEEAQNKLMAPMLRLEGIDRTEDWVKCLEESGYSDQAVYDTIDTSASSAEYYQYIVEASNEWAACARQNGFPQTIDAVLPSDDYSYPTALLPADISEVQLRALLEVCPSFDPAVEERNEELWNEMGDNYSGEFPEGFKGQPSIGFNYPNFDGTYDPNYVPSSSTASPDQVATEERLNKLTDILYEAQMQYWETYEEDVPG